MKRVLPNEMSTKENVDEVFARRRGSTCNVYLYIAGLGTVIDADPRLGSARQPERETIDAA